MNIAIVLFSLLPTLIKCSGEGNIRLLEEEVAVAMKACANPNENQKYNNDGSLPRPTTSHYQALHGIEHKPKIPLSLNSTTKANQRQRRSEDYPRIDSNEKNLGQSLYNHERRNTSGMKDQFYVLNATDYDYAGYGAGNSGEKYVSSVPRPTPRIYQNNNTEITLNRTKRNDQLLNKPDSDQCLSQCIFANLQAVDSRGIPREAELWTIVQSSVTSQQSRTVLRDQIRACFQELQSEAEDNGCSYSNKLERCLMLRFSDRKIDGEARNTTPKSKAI